jgi:hypothetical protein
MRKIIVLFAILIIGTSAAKAQGSDVAGAKSKFIYNFTNFFQWPNSVRSGDFVIGVVGSDDLFYELKDYTKGKQVITQNIAVKKFSNASNASDSHILYVSKYKVNQLDKLSKEDVKNTLVISDSQKAIDKGAAINFVLAGNRLRFEFAASNVMQSGLKFSSRIKDMATKNY